MIMRTTKKKKAKPVKFDGLNPDDLRKIKIALRKVWSWSFSRKLVEKRCLIDDGFSKCEQCKTIVPRIYVDHIKSIGAPDADLIKKMFVPSNQMQGLCSSCHKKKTRDDKKLMEAEKDFY